MAHLWLATDNQWQPAAIGDGVVALTSGGFVCVSCDGAPRGVKAPSGRRTPHWPNEVPRVQLRGEGGVWVLLAHAEAVAVNGAPLRLGIRLLRDRDELRLATGERYYFSTERLATVEPFVRAEPVCCPRCRQQIASGVPAVACPSCGAWCHQTDALPCWTYAATCPLCDQPSALEGGYRWTPAEL